MGQSPHYTDGEARSQGRRALLTEEGDSSLLCRHGVDHRWSGYLSDRH